MENSLSYRAYMNSPYRSIKHSTYFEVYDELFSRFRNKRITFVEIGILGGGSLFMWREFFGPEARIIGIDLNPKAKKWEQHGFEIYIGDQSDPNFWSDVIKCIGSPDIVLDDGGHTYEQQIITTEMLLSSINDDGILVIEDTHTSYMDGFGLKRYNFIKYSMNMIDKINRRFSAFNNDLADERVWSIQYFESIVVFHVNRKASRRPSLPTVNNGLDDFANDFRYENNPLVLSFYKQASNFKFLKKIPGLPYVKKLILNHLLYYIFKRNSTDRYFK